RSHAPCDPRSLACWAGAGERARVGFRAEPAGDLEASARAQAVAIGYRSKGRTRAAVCAAPRAVAEGGRVARRLPRVLAAQPRIPQAPPGGQMTSQRKAAARAVADTGDGVVLARVEIAVPPARVFAALTTDELTKWWGSAEMYRTTKFTIDLRPGGAWRTD